MRSHVRRTVSRSFATLRQLRTIRRQVPTAVFQSLVTACSASLRLLQQSAVWSAHFTDPASSVCRPTECHCAAHIHFTVFWAHLSCVHQPSLAAYPWTHLQIGSFNISNHSWCWTELLPVLLHSRRRHAVTTTTAFVRLWSLARTDHSTILSRQSHIYSFRRRGLERPAGSHHSCVVTRGLQTAP